MLYVKHKELTRNFEFSHILDKNDLPGYINHYLHPEEQIFCAYKTKRDHGVFTNKKIILFDNYSKSGFRKQIYSFSYNKISAISITFESKNAEMNLLLDNGYPLNLNFIEVKPKDKVRLRILYSCINQIISGQIPSNEDIKRLKKDDVSFK